MGPLLYGADWWDATLYDLVLHLKTITVDDAVGLIEHAVRCRVFKLRQESQQAIDNLVEATRLEVAPVWWEGSAPKQK